MSCVGIESIPWFQFWKSSDFNIRNPNKLYNGFPFNDCWSFTIRICKTENMEQDYASTFAGMVGIEFVSALKEIQLERRQINCQMDKAFIVILSKNNDIWFQRMLESNWCLTLEETIWGRPGLFLRTYNKKTRISKRISLANIELFLHNSFHTITFWRNCRNTMKTFYFLKKLP